MPFERVTLATLRSELQHRWEGVPFWTADDADDAIREALLVWNALTGYWRGSLNVTVPANDYFGSTPSGTLSFQCRALVSDRPLGKWSRSELDAIRPRWRFEYTDSGGDVPTQVEQWIPLGIALFQVWPIPRANLVVTVDGVRQTPRPQVNGDYIDLGEEEMGILLDEALHIASFKEPGDLHQRTFRLHLAFLTAAAERNAIFAASHYYRKQILEPSQRRALAPVRIADETTATLQQQASGGGE